MNRFILLPSLIFSVVLYSCDSQEENSNSETVSDSTEVVVAEVAPSPHDLILVDNQKWVIDEGMRVSIDSIEIRMNDFKGVTLEDYAALSIDLEHHTKSIIANCTMKGQAHDELHKWLLPFIDLRKELNGVTKVSQGETIARELNNELVVFNIYFE